MGGDESLEHSTAGNRDRMEIQLGHACTNRCVFCVSGQLNDTKRVEPVPLEPILESLAEARGQGISSVTLLGGEPTIAKTFEPTLRRAVELGFDEIVIFTNGAMFGKREFLERVAAMGRFTWRLSIQGGTAEAHDAVTNRAGSFDRLLAGMAILKELGQRVTANMCVNRLSYQTLDSLPRLLARYRIRQFHVDMVRPNDMGQREDDYLREVIPRYRDLAPHLAVLLEGLEALDPEYDVNVGNYPYCLLPAWGHRIHHDGQRTFTVSVDGDAQLSEPWNKYEQKRADKVHAPQCAECLFRSQCSGVYGRYVELYGSDELSAVSLEDLAVLDKGHRFFVLRFEETLGALLARGAPAKWILEGAFRSTRDRRVELRFTDAAGRRATLVFTPPIHGVGPDPVLEGERVHVGLVADADTDDEAVMGLALWADEVLFTELGLTAHRRANPNTMRRRAAPTREAPEVRHRIDELVELLRDSDGFGPDGSWRAGAPRELEGADGVSMRLEGPSDASVQLEFSVNTEPSRPPVSVSYSLGADTDPEEARGALRHIMGVLRGD